MAKQQDIQQPVSKRQSIHNKIVQPLLTDYYQITMAYAYWKANKDQDQAVFDLFFRRNPFQGEFTIFAGLEECLDFLENSRFSDSDIDYLKSTLPDTTEAEFYDFISTLTAKQVTIYSIDEGSLIFPRVPLLRVEGPLIIAQILETTLLNLINYASLLVTNAARYKMAAGGLRLLENGLRQAQGPDGGVSASKYSYIGGFDGTSNVLAGKLLNIPVTATYECTYVAPFTQFDDLQTRMLKHKGGGEPKDMLKLAEKYRNEITPICNAVCSGIPNNGELAAFVSFAIAFPDQFTISICTYDPIRSGLPNFCAVSLALNELGYRPLGIRIDSGDLTYLSNIAKDCFTKIGNKYGSPWFKDLTIMASKCMNEETLLGLIEQGHKIDCFSIGTHLVTCQKQPALGCVYKMVELNGQARMKLGAEISKVTIPGRKEAYRLYSESDHALLDLLQKADEQPPQVNQKLLCRHPFQESKRAFVTPSKVERLYKVYWKDGKVSRRLPSMDEIRARVEASVKSLRPDTKRYLNPTPYKVSVSDNLYSFMHELWLAKAPIGELS